MNRILFLFLVLPFLSIGQNPETWIHLPYDDWPQIALTNHVQYKNGDRYIDPSFEYAGTGFLIDTGEDTLAATAKHVLWIARNTLSSKVQINDQLEEWIMKPKGKTTDQVLIDELLNEDSAEVLQGPNASITERDWLVFSIRNNSKNIYPLKPRSTRLNPGEKLFILSCAYLETVCGVHEARVIRKEGMDVLLRMSDNKNLPGSSGSPIIDTSGFLVGVLSSAGLDPVTGEGLTKAVSTEYLFKVLRREDEYNTPRKNYGDLIFQAVLEQGVRKAIRKYKALVENPKNYYMYNIHNINKNGLRETGQKLIDLGLIRNAVRILKLNAMENGGYYVNHNILASAYLRLGQKKKAIKSYRRSTEVFIDRNNEAHMELENISNRSRSSILRDR